MPCKSDYMNPTTKEKELKETAQLLIYVNNQCGISSPKELVIASQNDYCSDDYVPELCRMLKSMSEEGIERIVYNARDPQSRRLADWWEKHKAADEAREKLIQEEMKKARDLKNGLNKLTDDEREAIRQHFRTRG